MRLARGVRCAIVAVVVAMVSVVVPAPFGASARSSQQLWRSVTSRPSGSDAATAVAIGPDGSTTFVAGLDWVQGKGLEFSFTAFATLTGDRLWSRRVLEAGDPYPTGVTVSPDGKRVFFTGSDYSDSTQSDIYTFAYDTATGERLWVSLFDGARHGDDGPASILASPDGATVYVAGQMNDGQKDRVEMVVLAYEAATGDLEWTQRYRSPDGRDDAIRDAALGPDGSRLYVFGSAATGDDPLESDFVTMALDASSGARLWTTRMGRGRSEFEYPGGIAVSPDASRVYIDGSVFPSVGKGSTETISYDAATGARVWVSKASAEGADYATSVAVTPDGTAVVEAGSALSGGLLAAYDAATGDRRWLRVFSAGGAGEFLTHLGLSPDGSVGYAAGILCMNSDCDLPRYMSTIAFSTSDGSRQWSARSGSTKTDAREFAMAVSPDGKAVVVVGDDYMPHGDVGRAVVVAYGGS